MSKKITQVLPSERRRVRDKIKELRRPDASELMQDASGLVREHYDPDPYRWLTQERSYTNSMRLARCAPGREPPREI